MVPALEKKSLPTDLRDTLQKLDFKSIINKQVEVFWSRHKKNWRTLPKAEFLSTALKSEKKGHSSNADLKHLLSGVAPAL
jgi:hypothetical protein